MKCYLFSLKLHLPLIPSLTSSGINYHLSDWNLTPEMKEGHDLWGEKKPRMNHFLLQWRVNRPDPLLSPFRKRSILLFSTFTLPFIRDGQRDSEVIEIRFHKLLHLIIEDKEIPYILIAFSVTVQICRSHNRSISAAITTWGNGAFTYQASVKYWISLSKSGQV